MSKMQLDIRDLEIILEKNLYGFKVKILKIDEQGLMLNLEQIKFSFEEDE